MGKLRPGVSCTDNSMCMELVTCRIRLPAHQPHTTATHQDTDTCTYMSARQRALSRGTCRAHSPAQTNILARSTAWQYPIVEIRATCR